MGQSAKLRIMKSLLLAILVALPLLAEEPRKPEAVEPPATADYVRFSEPKTGPMALQTAIVRFVKKDLSVDLISVVHLADPAYYQRLNQELRHYDAVLYEMVGGPVPPKSQLDKRDRGDLAWLGALHGTLKSSLGLQGQLDGMDYTPPNMVHADVSHAEFNQLKAQKSESFIGLLFRAYQAQAELAAMGEVQSGMSLTELTALLSGTSSKEEMKAIIGRQFDSVEKLMAGIEGPNGSVIIGERNNKALKVMENELAKGRKQLAIFYGGAHLPDLELKLVKAGWTPQPDQKWLDAWTITR
jgi:hypothetical protein